MNGNERNGYDRKRDWKNGVPKPHRYPCPLCAGLLHPRGRHFSPGHVQLFLAKMEREAARAAACGYGTGDTAVAAD